jgi:hypothetical protein
MPSTAPQRKRTGHERVLTSSWSDSPQVFRPRRIGNWLLIGMFAAIGAGTGLDVWYELGWSSQSGRAICLGLMLLAALWSLGYGAAKIAIGVAIARDGITAMQGPLYRYMPWSDVEHLRERSQMEGLRRRRWVVAEAYDGRKLLISEAAVGDYEAFRASLQAVYREWQARARLVSAPWHSTSGAPFVAREVPGASRWLRYFAIMVALPGVYFVTAFQATAVVGYALVALSGVLVLLSVRLWARRQTLILDNHGIEVRTRFGARRMAWDLIARADRSRHPLSPAMRVADRVFFAILQLVNRQDSWTGGSRWPVLPPDELVVRGAGHRITIRLHRMAEPDVLVLGIQQQIRALSPHPAYAKTTSLSTSPGPRQPVRTTQRLQAATPPESRPLSDVHSSPILDPAARGDDSHSAPGEDTAGNSPD